MNTGHDSFSTWAALIASAAAITGLFVGVEQSIIVFSIGSVPVEELHVLKWHWGLVALSTLAFLAFVALIPIRLKRDWKAHGIYVAFIVSLFSEMFGFPLSIYFISSLFGLPLLEQNFMRYMLTIGMPLGSIVTFLGILLIIFGWKELYRSKNSLATRGIYGYFRHPQYLGIILISGGWVIHWPTIPGILMWPILILIYHRLSKSEDRHMAEEYGKEYSEYVESTR